ncbi:leucine-rich repeat domain, L domain-like protein [Artemisia annua]|uniref:Leucine-rich repeat domain, L domain-like protein n=1 Tax=Artemisia annua TaxID=35608 RepID=A0A2U1N3C9_ARTAN|nr:leucine-rich repeat domain, L domain-like protein [Artemisia annua]
MSCDGIEEVVSNRDDEDESMYSPTTSLFPHLDILNFYDVTNFKCIGGGANGISTDIHDQLKLSQASWSLCQYSREISITNCDALSSVIPWYAVGKMQKLRVLEIINCRSMTEVFETQEINNKSGTNTGNLAELEELEIMGCEGMEVIVKKESGELTTTSDVVVFPHLKSLILFDLPNFVGFFLGKNEFIWPALEKVLICECPQITVFTYGRSTAPKLNFINTSLGKHSVECGLNFRVTTTSHQADLEWLSRLKYIWKSKQGTVLKFPNLTRLSIQYCSSLEYVFTCSMVGSISQLQELHISDCKSMKVILKGEEESDAIVNAIVVFPCLKSLKLDYVKSLRRFCVEKEAFSFPSLDTLQIKLCQKMTVFTKGELSAPKLYAIRTRGRKYNIHDKLNSFLNTLNKRECNACSKEHRAKSDCIKLMTKKKTRSTYEDIQKSILGRLISP